MSITVFQYAYGQGYRAVETAVKIASGEDAPENLAPPDELVNADTAEDHLTRYGDRI